MNSDMPPGARGFLVILLTIGMLGFGAVGLCGGYFTVSVVPALLEGHFNVAMFLVLSVPCLTGGLFMVKICMEKIRQLLRKPPVGEEPS